MNVPADVSADDIVVRRCIFCDVCACLCELVFITRNVFGLSASDRCDGGCPDPAPPPGAGTPTLISLSSIVGGTLKMESRRGRSGSEFRRGSRLGSSTGASLTECERSPASAPVSVCDGVLRGDVVSGEPAPWSPASYPIGTRLCVESSRRSCFPCIALRVCPWSSYSSPGAAPSSSLRFKRPPRPLPSRLPCL